MKQWALLLLLPFFAACGQPAAIAPAQEQHTMKLTVTLDKQTFTATLADNPTSRDLYRQLPLTLAVEDYAASEKTATPPQKLSTAGAPARYQGKAGDITYYAPWGNLALFYKNGPDAPGLIYLGKFDMPFTPGQAAKIRIEAAD